MKFLKTAACFALFCAIACFNVVKVTGQTFLTDGLTSYYPFSGNAKDAVGTNDGIVAGAILTSDRFAASDSAYLFNSRSNSAINVPATTVNNLTNGTIAVWLELDRNTNEYVFAKQHDYENTYAALSVGSYAHSEGGPASGLAGQVYFHAINYVPVVSSPVFLSTGLWHQVVVTFSPTNCALYVNGSLTTNVSGDFSIPDDVAATSTSIGAWQTASQTDYSFDGKIDEMRIYNRQLSVNEVAQLYADTSSTNARIARAAAVVTNGFVIGVTVTDSGLGYTNTPTVRFVGGGGSGAEAVAVVANGAVTAINMISAGTGYTSAPVVVIDPPILFSPVLSIAPMTFLTFSNLTVGGTYQLQQLEGWYWTNLAEAFAASNAMFTSLLPGVAGSVAYRLAISPAPAQAFATPQVINGFVVGANVISGGSGYVTAPAVRIVGGGGTNATAFSQISGGVVTKITVTGAGTGYTNTPTIQIDPPPAASLSPAISPVMRLDSRQLIPYGSYQIQAMPALDGAWSNWPGGAFTPTDVTNSECVFVTNGMGFFRTFYMP